MSATNCLVLNCKINSHNKPSGILFHPCPTSRGMRQKWHNLLKNRCMGINWTKSKICSKHFDEKHFDSQRQLKDNAIPTLFPISRPAAKSNVAPKSRMDMYLSKLSQAEIMVDINKSIQAIDVISNVEEFYTDDWRPTAKAPVEAEMWLVIKKQDHLNKRLLEINNQNKKYIEKLQRNVEHAESNKKATEQSLETYKYIAKCLQEKLATLEEQVEILTAVEAR